MDANEENLTILEGKLISLLQTTMAIDEKRRRGIKILVLSPSWEPGKAKACAERMMEYFNAMYQGPIEKGALVYKKYPFPSIEANFFGLSFPSVMYFRDYDQHFREGVALARKHFDVIWMFD